MPTSTMALMGRFASLVGRFPALMGAFPRFRPKGPFYLLKSQWKTVWSSHSTRWFSLLKIPQGKHLLDIRASPSRRRRKSENRRFSQKTAGIRSLGSVTLGPSPLARPYFLFYVYPASFISEAIVAAEAPLEFPVFVLETEHVWAKSNQELPSRGDRERRCDEKNDKICQHGLSHPPPPPKQTKSTRKQSFLILFFLSKKRNSRIFGAQLGVGILFLGCTRRGSYSAKGRVSAF